MGNGTQSKFFILGVFAYEKDFDKIIKCHPCSLNDHLIILGRNSCFRRGRKAGNHRYLSSRLCGPVPCRAES